MFFANLQKKKQDSGDSGCQFDVLLEVAKVDTSFRILTFLFVFHFLRFLRMSKKTQGGGDLGPQSGAVQEAAKFLLLAFFSKFLRISKNTR